MHEIGNRREERRRELTEDFLSLFGNVEDAELAATMLVMAVAPPVSKRDRLGYLAALERLPKGSTVKPRLLLVSVNDGGAAQQWRVTFADDHAGYQSSRQFPTEAEANTYATNFLERLQGQINRP
jgi:hypothetical protein